MTINLEDAVYGYPENLDTLLSEISEIKISFDPRDLLMDPTLVDDTHFTNLLNQWRPVLEDCEDAVRELKAAREVVRAAKIMQDNRCISDQDFIIYQDDECLTEALNKYEEATK